MNGIAIAILLLTFVFLLVIKCPITFSMVISTSLAMLYLDIPVMTMVQQMCKQLNSFTLLAIPFFILMGEIMGAGGISAEEKQALLAVLRLLAAGNDAAMTAYARLEALWSAPQPPKENVFAVLGRAILGKMSLGRNE